MMIHRTSTLMMVALFTVACGGDAEPDAQPLPEVPAAPAGPVAVPFDSGVAHVVTASDSLGLRVYIAETEAQRALGLMDRDALDQDAGMIFLYDQQQAGSSGFWMYRTRIPLDIAFLDGAGRIVAIRHMQPCPSSDQMRCMDLAREYTPGAPYYGALEVNAGYFAEHGVGEGDRVVMPGRIGG